MAHGVNVLVLAMVAMTRVDATGEALQMFKPPAGDRNIIDMTYDFAVNETIYWPTSEPFNLTVAFKGVMPESGVYYEANNFCAAEHGGTHIDAPAHFYRGSWVVDHIPIDGLIGDAVVVDVTAKVSGHEDYQATELDLRVWEEKHGRIPDGGILFLYTGWGRHWPNKERYLGTNTKNTSILHFPGLHSDAAKWLVENRKIKAFGIDTASLDYGQSKTFKTHTILFEKNIVGIENVANLDQLPPTGAMVIGLPMKIRGGSGAPLRIIGLLPQATRSAAIYHTATEWLILSIALFILAVIAV
ncbi:PREDICTED: kynurenine formamidase-like [Priapulus caudatus]|uniref:Kynurenine formamidase-like n=1 Tax=Priapulus caudatus TaxID=37621 RepID=A0ABM1FAJ6_PRICU|nr:PREDICTED: kynurenine formamidase-like [Priapulus caudatus]